jgi:hypothetical protein
LAGIAPDLAVAVQVEFEKANWLNLESKFCETRIPNFRLKSEKQSAEAILNTRLTSQAYKTSRFRALRQLNSTCTQPRLVIAALALVLPPGWDGLGVSGWLVSESLPSGDLPGVPSSIDIRRANRGVAAQELNTFEKKQTLRNRVFGLYRLQGLKPRRFQAIRVN